MRYGYCRISRPKQSIERQIRNIKAVHPDAVIVQEVFTRTRIDRKEWQRLFSKVKDGDTIIFDSVSRMSGNAEEGFAAYEELFNRGVNLEFLKEPHINTDSVPVAMVIYGLMIILTRSVTEDELRDMPFGMRIVRLCRKLHLM